MAKKKDEITEILFRHKILTPESLLRVQQEIKKTGLSFTQVLEKLGIISQEKLANLIAEEIGIPLIDLGSYFIDKEVLKLIPQEIAKKYKIMPLFKIGDILTIAMANPRDILIIDEIKQITKVQEIEPLLALEDTILETIEKYYSQKEEVTEIIKSIQDKESIEEAGDTGVMEVKEAPIIKLVNLIITQAVRDRASDIHIEPEKDLLRVRYRIDGVLQEVNTFSKHLQNVIVSRIKLMANMDIAEKRTPQDGKINLKIENKDLDIRVSSFPTLFGENIVMRILDKSSIFLGLKELGFQKDDLERFQRLISASHGIVLVTGPTGSGKTTTLYAALTAINSMEKNIITIEDPVEYQLPLIRQTQVNPKAGLTFATGLRSILRQDPDIIMVGEIRDRETAEIAIQAALTGHLVFSTLHTNDAPSTLVRLIDMGVESFLVAGTILGVVAQRLIRVNCQECKEKVKPLKEVLRELSIEKKEIVVYKGRGCDNCRGTGYRSRTGIFEILTMSESIKKLVLKRASAYELRQVALEEGMRPLLQDGLDKAFQGITTLEEVLRVTRE